MVCGARQWPAGVLLRAARRHGGGAHRGPLPPSADQPDVPRPRRLWPGGGILRPGTGPRPIRRARDGSGAAARPAAPVSGIEPDRPDRSGRSLRQPPDRSARRRPARWPVALAADGGERSDRRAVGNLRRSAARGARGRGGQLGPDRGVRARWERPGPARGGTRRAGQRAAELTDPDDADEDGDGVPDDAVSEEPDEAVPEAPAVAVVAVAGSEAFFSDSTPFFRASDG